MFQDLVEAEIFYTALFDTPKTRIFNRTVFHNMPNILTEILPDCKEYEDIVKSMPYGRHAFEVILRYSEQ